MELCIQWPTPSHVYFLSVGLQAGVLLKEFVLLIKSSLITNKKEAIELNIQLEVLLLITFCKTLIFITYGTLHVCGRNPPICYD